VLDLDASAVRQHWLSVAPGLGPLFEQIERVEDWTVDDVPAIAGRIVSFGHSMSAPGVAGALEHADPLQLLYVLVHMSSSRALRIIQWLDENHDGLGARLVEAMLHRDGAAIYAGVPHETLARTLITRLSVFNNKPFFAGIFAPQRLRKISRAIERYRQESGDA